MSTFDASAAYAATSALVTHVQTQADAAIARLTSQATAWSISALSAVSNLSLSTLATATGTKPALLTLTLPTYVPPDFSGLVMPTLPSTPSLSAGTAPLWNETFWSNLKTGISSFIGSISNASSVDSAVDILTSEQTRMESALFYRDYERKSQVLRDMISVANVGTGAKGFSRPNSLTTAIILDATQKYQFDLSETSRALVTHIFDWAKSNYQFSLQQGVAAHNADIEFNTRYLDTTIKAYTATVSALVEQYKVEVDAAVAQARFGIEEFVARVNTELAKQRELEDIRIKEASFDLDVSKTNAGISEAFMKLQIADFHERVNNFLSTAKLNLEDRDANIKNQITAASAAATATAALATSASTITFNAMGA